LSGKEKNKAERRDPEGLLGLKEKSPGKKGHKNGAERAGGETTPSIDTSRRLSGGGIRGTSPSLSFKTGGTAGYLI